MGEPISAKLIFVNVAIEIPDEIGRVLASQSGGISRAVLEAVAARQARLLRTRSAINPACAIYGTNRSASNAVPHSRLSSFEPFPHSEP